MAESMLFFRAYRDALRCLPEKEQLAALSALLDYGLDGIEPEAPSGAALAVFTIARPSMDASARRRENGKKGGRPKKKAAQRDDTNGSETEKPLVSQKEKPPETMPCHDKDKDKDIDVDKDIDIDIDSGETPPPPAADAPSRGPRERFSPPGRAEVEAYAAEAKLELDAGAFLDYYAANGWRVGKAPMKDWRAAARGWSRRARASPARPAQGFRRVYRDDEYEEVL